MDIIKTTIGDFASKHNIEYSIVSGFFKFLELKGLVKVIGNQPNATGKGKPSKIYEVPMKIEISLKEDT